MNGRRSPYEIYWEILVYCKSPRSFTAVINRCDLNSKTGQEYLEFLHSKGYLSVMKDGEKSTYVATECAGDYIALFTEIYQKLFDTIPGFRL
ncbi:MAG: winged helix-turn-helix domain-containing protein [Methanoregula sp.]|jgi:predicted transcriptional regulator